MGFAICRMQVWISDISTEEINLSTFLFFLWLFFFSVLVDSICEIEL